MPDTIFAPATPSGGAIGIIRLSGPAVRDTLARLFVPVGGTSALVARQMTFGRLMEGETVIDSCMACFFEGPKSYTGEDMAELYLHGGQAVMKAALNLLAAVPHTDAPLRPDAVLRPDAPLRPDAVLRTDAVLRSAAPGEFTQRAFLNGKMDLSQAESVMDLINASTRRSAKSAAEQLGGSVSKAVKGLEDKLLDLLSAINAALDYPDELEEETLATLPVETAALLDSMNTLLAGSVRGRVLREGAVVAIAGAPNAGKSSLFNALVGSERAIVTAQPGTTRDLVEETIDLEGAPVRLVDTAGLRACGDEAEQIGIARAREAALRADFILLAFDCATPLTGEDRAFIASTAGRPRLGVLCKSDLPPTLAPAELEALGLPCLSVSAAEGAGLGELKRRLAQAILPGEEAALITNSRQAEALLEARRALQELIVEDGADCAAAQLRQALCALGKITGREADAEMIELIFSRFCVGK